jgi:hypothetical protein
VPFVGRGNAQIWDDVGGERRSRSRVSRVRWRGCRHDLDQLSATVRAGRQVIVGGPRGRLVPERFELAEAVGA